MGTVLADIYSRVRNIFFDTVAFLHMFKVLTWIQLDENLIASTRI